MSKRKEPESESETHPEPQQSFIVGKTFVLAVDTDAPEYPEYALVISDLDSDDEINVCTDIQWYTVSAKNVHVIDARFVPYAMVRRIRRYYEKYTINSRALRYAKIKVDDAINALMQTNEELHEMQKLLH